MNYLPIAGKYHFWIDNGNLLNIHSDFILKRGDTITVKGRELTISKIRVDQDSSYYPNHKYYELEFQEK